jgi:uncharacterized radical SAM superfamily Fe-S cluster-containing enzyme
MRQDPCDSCSPAGEPLNYLGQSRGLCRECGAKVPVRYIARGQRVFLQRHCPTHGKHEALVAGDLSWYLEAMSQEVAPCPPPKVHADKTAACPDACGPCLFHGQRCHLPVIPITNACNLRCPICFGYNRDNPYHMPVADFGRRIDFLLEATGGVDLINITGGEPPLHPELPAILRQAKRPGIGRITMNSNGILLGRSPELCAMLAELGIYVVLSIDTLQAERSKQLHGVDLVQAKLDALDMLEQHRIPTTLLHVLVPGVNDDEMGTWLDLLARKSFVRSLTIQTMTYTGQGGASFQPRRLIPVDEVERLIEAASRGAIAVPDFIPLPTAHPLCYGVSYLLAGEDALFPMTRLVSRAELGAMARDGYLLHPTDAAEDAMKAALDRLWSEGLAPGLLQACKRMLVAVYPPGPPLDVYERQRRGEAFVKTIFVHAHMDEDTYEIGRAMRCPDQVVTPDDCLIGACNYNLMYRMPDPLFGAGK